MFKQCYALEKIHGTSAHISIRTSDKKITLSEGHYDNGIRYFSGGEKHERFVCLFDENEELAKNLVGVGLDVVIYGEAYGGKQQGMSKTYGKELRFVAFDVKIGESWLTVSDAAEFVAECGLEFVAWEKISTDLDELNRLRDQPSTQAARNGMGFDKHSEGVVLRPLMELTKNNGKRVISKHKRDEFRETTKKRKVLDPAKLTVLSEANEVATEWVTFRRIEHILDKITDHSVEKMREILNSMCEDVKREGKGEIVWSKEVEKAICKETALKVKSYYQSKLRRS